MSKPTEPGWYWWQWWEDGKWRAVEVVSNHWRELEFFACGTTRGVVDGASEWGERIPSNEELKQQKELVK